ncbi:hypothetical protein K1719_045166 [Acacia pycnantha]|nr:hypothetical protein K1719_045166 [Acacia pycnantha]
MRMKNVKSGLKKSASHNFKSLKSIDQLKGLCNSEVEIHEEGFYNNSLPELEYLTVEDCPMFSETTLAALQSCKERNLRYD